ncbi:MAG: autotransporter domain-containing protein [Pseudomonadota bacterium]
MRSWLGVLAAIAAALVFVCAPESAVAQPFNQFVVFGDSTVDSGWYRNALPLSDNAAFNAGFAIAVTQGAGKATTSPGLVYSEYLAGALGLSANPANQPGGGTNYATGGARNNQVNDLASGGLQGAVPTSTQVDNYLAANGGAANSKALYLISSGGNDVGFALSNLAANQRDAYVTTAANDLVAAAAKLRNAGARIFIVPNQPQSIGTANQQALRTLYNNTLWNGLAAAGINFIPADINAVFLAVRGNSAFGFTATGPACTQPAGITSGWASLCSATSTVSTFVTPDAPNTHLLADDIHLTSAGQKIVADYEYSLLVAPSMISMLAEAPVKTRAGAISAIENQMMLSQRQRGPNGFNAWVTGDLANLKIENTQGFPNDPGVPATLIAGIDYKTRDWLFGAAISAGTQTAKFDQNFGNFRQNEVTLSGYGLTRHGPLWGSLIGTAGLIDYSVQRTVPIGITVQPNAGSTSGSNLSLSASAGYDLVFSNVTHGPIASMTFQRVKVLGFTESGSFTSLSFGDQTRNSAVSALGYQVVVDLERWRPFGRILWNHELANTNRDVLAALTTIAAPSYTMPAVIAGKDWGSAVAGTSFKIGDRVSGLLALSGQFAQRQVSVYGGQLGVNAAF